MEAVRRSALRTFPFPHARLEDVWPSDVYPLLLASLPPETWYRDDNPAKYGRADGRSCRQVLPLGALPEPSPLWTAVNHALTSSALHAAVCARFGLRANRRDGRPRSAARPTLVRDLPGYWIEPHPDSRAKHVTLQFYLAADHSQETLGTTLYRLRPFRMAAWLGRVPFMEAVDRLPFRPNSGYCFPVSWRSFHGVDHLPAGAGVRHTLMNTYYWRAAS